MADWINNLAGLELFSKLPNWASPPSRNWELGRDTIRYNLGVASLRERTIHHGKEIVYQMLMNDKTDEYDLTKFFHDRCGMLNRFWLPIRFNDIILDESVPTPGVPFIYSGSTVIPIIDNGYSITDQSSRRLNIETVYGDRLVVGINSATSTEINISVPIDRDIFPGDVTLTSNLALVRFDHNNLEFSFLSDSLSECQLSFKELSNEYPELEIIS
jgi:hypothetical protein